MGQAGGLGVRPRTWSRTHPEHADQAHDGDPRRVEHEGDQAQHDHEHVQDVPTADAGSGACAICESPCGEGFTRSSRTRRTSAQTYSLIARW